MRVYADGNNRFLVSSCNCGEKCKIEGNKPSTNTRILALWPKKIIIQTVPLKSGKFQ